MCSISVIALLLAVANACCNLVPAHITACKLYLMNINPKPFAHV